MGSIYVYIARICGIVGLMLLARFHSVLCIVSIDRVDIIVAINRASSLHLLPHAVGDLKNGNHNDEPCWMKEGGAGRAPDASGSVCCFGPDAGVT